MAQDSNLVVQLDESVSEKTEIEPVLNQSLQIESTSPIVTVTVEPETNLENMIDETEEEERTRIPRISFDESTIVHENSQTESSGSSANKDVLIPISGGNSPRCLENNIGDIGEESSFTSHIALKAVFLILKNIQIKRPLKTSSKDDQEHLSFKVLIGGAEVFKSPSSIEGEWLEVHVPTGIGGPLLSQLEQLKIDLHVMALDDSLGTSKVSEQTITTLLTEVKHRSIHQTSITKQQPVVSQPIVLSLTSDNGEITIGTIQFDAYLDLELTTVAVGKSTKTGGLREPQGLTTPRETPPNVDAKPADIVFGSERRNTITSRLSKMVPKSAKRALKLTVLDAKPLGSPDSMLKSDSESCIKKKSSLLSRFSETVIQMKFQAPTIWRDRKGTKGKHKLRKSVETSAAEVFEDGKASWRQSREGTLTLPLKENDDFTTSQQRRDDDGGGGGGGEDELDSDYDSDDYEEDDDALLEYASNGLAASFQRSDLNATVVVDLMGRRSGATDVLIGSTETTVREILRNSVTLDPESMLSLDVAPEHASSLSVVCDDVKDIPNKWALSFDASMVICDDNEEEDNGGDKEPLGKSASSLTEDMELQQQLVEPEAEVNEEVFLPSGRVSADPKQSLFKVPDVAKQSITKKKANDLARRRQLSLKTKNQPAKVDHIPDIVWHAQRAHIKPPAWRSELTSAQLIQRIYRGYIIRSKHKKLIASVITISRYYRGLKCRKKVMKIRQRRLELEQESKESSERKLRRLKLESEMKMLKEMNAEELAKIRSKDMEQAFKERTEMLKRKASAFLAVSKIREADKKTDDTTLEQDEMEAELIRMEEALQVSQLEKEALEVLRSGRVSQLATRRAIGVSHSSRETHFSSTQKGKDTMGEGITEGLGDLVSLHQRVEAAMRVKKQNKAMQSHQSKDELYHDLFEARKQVAVGFEQRGCFSTPQAFGMSHKGDRNRDWEHKKQHLRHTRRLMTCLEELPSLSTVRSHARSKTSALNPLLAVNQPTSSSADPCDGVELSEDCRQANGRILDALRAEERHHWWSAVMPEDLSGTPRDVRDAREDPWESSLWWYAWARKVTAMGTDGKTRKVSYVDFHGDSVSQADILHRWQELGVEGRQAVATLQNAALSDRAKEWAVAICDEVWRQRRLVIGPRQLDELITRKKDMLMKSASLIQKCWRDHNKRMVALRVATQDKVMNALSLLVNAVSGATGTQMQASMLRHLADDLVSNVASK